MRPRSWDELEVDAKLRYQMGLVANTGVGRGFADACAALMRIIPLLRQHFASEDVDPLISLGTLVFHTAERNLIIYIFCERYGLPCEVSVHDWENSTTHEVTRANIDELIQTLRNYLEKVAGSPGNAL